MKKPKYLNDKDAWMVGEKIPDSDIFFFQICFSCFGNNRSYNFIKHYNKVLAVYNRFEMDFYFGENNSFDVAESILRALIERPKFGNHLNKNIVEWSKKLIQFAEYTSHLPLAKYSNKQLWGLYKKHDDLHTKLYTYGWLPVSVDMFHNNFTNKLKSYLYSVCDSKEDAEKAFIVFTTPTTKTIVAGEREDFLKIYEKFKKKLGGKILPKDLEKELTKHAEKWGHLGYIYAGNTDPFGIKHYLKEMKDLKASGVSGQSILAKEEKQLEEAKRAQDKLNKKFKINALYKRLFKIARDFAITKLFRRHAQLRSLYLLHTTLLTEIARRLKVSRYQVQFMIMREVKEALLKGKIDRKLLSQRLRKCTYYTEKGLEVIYVGKKDKEIRKKVKQKIDKNIRELIGQTAMGGFAKGKVVKIFRAKDIPKMRKGDILVSIATDPDVVPAMKIAGAIVTEQGGITSHAAIVSRELGIPCVIGTKIATSVFKEGDLVEVDADKGVVKRI